MDKRFIGRIIKHMYSIFKEKGVKFLPGGV